MVAPIAIADFKAYFNRDFKFGTAADSVTDADLTKAIAEANVVFNTGLWGADELLIAFEYLVAHCLVSSLRNNGGLGTQKKGVFSSGGGPVANKSAGPLSVGYTLSSVVTESPTLAQFMETGYGMRYLGMLMPRLAGNVVCAEGATTP